ncbi:MAG: hypothetical protein ABI540_04330 [Spartobacteria bacterium]
MSHRPSSRKVFFLALALIAGLKLWLVHGEEIVGSATQYDALWYVRSASHWYWGTPYDWIAFIRPPTYPLFIAIMRLLHLPLRFAIELLQIGGALALVVGLRALGVSRWAAVVSFILICFHPIGYQQNDYTMSDTFYAGMLWFVLGGMLLTLARRNLWSAFGTGVAVAILWNAREEGILLVALILVGTVSFFVPGISQRPVTFYGSIRPIALLWITAILLTVSAYTANHAVYRSFARSEMTAPAFQSLYHSLLRIQPAEPKPYAPITTDTLQRASAVSPTFAKLRVPLEGPLGEAWRVETFRRTGTPNEIGVGWIVWATRQAAAAQGFFSSPRTARRFFTKAAQEISRACDNGRLPTRFVIGGFLDPFAQSDAGSRLPASIARVTARVFAQWTIEPLPDDNILTKEEASLYDRMTLRRSEGVPPRHGIAVATERFVGRFHWFVMVVLHSLAAVACVLLLFFHRRVREQAGVICAIALLLSVVLLRWALLVWLDATAFDATQDRFLFPILPLWSVALVVLIWLCAKTARKTSAP